MKLEIQKMRISNFKGTKEREVVFSGDVTHIAGANGTGKTTIQDAFCWVLFNQDSRGNAPGSDHFREKPLGDDGQEIHNLDTTVELQCRLDGKPFHLKRTQRENWVKKRGSVEATYTGNTSTYWINDVETSLKDFKGRIAEIVSEDVFRLIGSLSAFNAMDWKKRRQQLMAMIDHNVDEALMTKAEYSALSDACEDRNLSVDDLRKVLADQKRRANDELKLIPARIDEVRMTISDIKSAEVREAKAGIEELERQISAIDGEIMTRKQDNGMETLVARLKAKQAERDAVQSASVSRWQIDRDALAADSRKTEQELKNILAAFQELGEQIKSVEGQIASGKSILEKLRSRYMQVKGRTFVSSVSGTCPACGQQLPEEKVKEAVDKARQAFEAEKKDGLNLLKLQGVDQATVVERREKELFDLTERRDVLQQRCSAAALHNQATKERLEAYPVKPVLDTPELETLEEEISGLLSQITDQPDDDTKAMEREKVELKERIKAHEALLLKAESSKAAKKRVEELEAQQKDQGIKIAELENLIALSESYVTERCLALSESVNEKFDTISWKLFDTQVNGGIVDTCVCMIPCDSGLVAYESANTASQINADMEIVNALSKHYDVSLPLFVDGAERINHIPKIQLQLITLTVSTEPEITVK